MWALNPGDPPDHREIGEFLGEADLEVVAGHGLVERQRLGEESRPLLGRVGVGEVGSGAGPVDRAGQVRAADGVGSQVGRERLDAAAVRGHPPEPSGRGGLRPGDCRSRGDQQFLAARPARGGVHPVADLGGIAQAEDAGADLGVLLVELGQQVEPGVQLLGRAVGRGVHSGEGGVGLAAVGEEAEAGFVVGPAGKLPQDVPVGGERGPDLLGQQAIPLLLGAQRWPARGSSCGAARWASRCSIATRTRRATGSRPARAPARCRLPLLARKSGTASSAVRKSRS